MIAVFFGELLPSTQFCPRRVPPAGSGRSQWQSCHSQVDHTCLLHFCCSISAANCFNVAESGADAFVALTAGSSFSLLFAAPLPCLTVLTLISSHSFRSKLRLDPLPGRFPGGGVCGGGERPPPPQKLDGFPLAQLSPTSLIPSAASTGVLRRRRQSPLCVATGDARDGDQHRLCIVSLP